MCFETETITNLTLLENDLEHLLFELERPKACYFRVAKEAYQALYRAMVEALRGTANLAITGRPKDKQRRRWYHIGDGPWMMISKVPIEGCERAWRFSAPSPEEPPDLDNASSRRVTPDFLLGFFDLLAMIQTECCMSRFVMSTPVRLTDDQMRSLEFLTLHVRHEFEHYVPKHYTATVQELVEVALLALDVTARLLLESETVVAGKELSGIRCGLDRATALLRSLLRGEV